MATIDLHLTQAEMMAIQDGKTHLLKDRPYGRAGDTFSLEENWFEIIDVCERSLTTIIDRFGWLKDNSHLPIAADGGTGADTGWYDPETPVYIHWFRIV